MKKSMSIKEKLLNVSFESGFNKLSKENLSRIVGGGGNSCGTTSSSDGCDDIAICGSGCPGHTTTPPIKGLG